MTLRSPVFSVNKATILSVAGAISSPCIRYLVKNGREGDGGTKGGKEIGRRSEEPFLF